MVDRVQENVRWHPRLWTGLIGIAILLIFLYFYQPFETYLAANIGYINFHNIVFWFASLVGVTGYAFAHWQAFRQHIVRSKAELQVGALVFDTLQIAILTAVIFTAGATLQAVEILGVYLIERGPIFDRVFGAKLLAIVLLVIAAVLFYLLHRAVRAFRHGWQPRKPPRRAAAANR